MSLPFLPQQSDFTQSKFSGLISGVTCAWVLPLIGKGFPFRQALLKERGAKRKAFMVGEIENENKANVYRSVRLLREKVLSLEKALNGLKCFLRADGFSTSCRQQLSMMTTTTAVKGK